jgi:hypothetical protein
VNHWAAAFSGFFAWVVVGCRPLVRGLKNGIIRLRFAMCAAAHLALNLSASNGMPFGKFLLKRIYRQHKKRSLQPVERYAGL